MKVLCFLPNYIGDVLMTTPSLRVLKKSLPESYINVIVKANLSELLEGNINIDNIVIKNNNRLELLKKVLMIKPDYILLFRTTFFNSFVSYMVKAKIAVGIKRELSQLFLTKTLSYDIARPYRSECLMLVEEFLKYLNIYKDFPYEELKKIDFFSWDKEEVKSSLDRKLVENNIDINKKFIIISPCASRKTKVLTPQQYIEIIKMLYQKYKKDYEIVLVNISENDVLIKSIIRESGNFVKSLCGKTSLRELGYLFSISSLIITPDSGPAYIAESVGVKTLIYFTSTVPEKYGPYPNNVKFLYNPTICSPCYKDFCPLKTYNCIKNVSSYAILDLVDEILS